MNSSIVILIVEDEALFARTLESQVKKMGYPYVNIAITYKEAIDSIQNQIPDLILLDIDLNDEYNSGIDIANEKNVLNKIPIIYLTATTDSKIQKKLIATNPKSYLIKPIRFEALTVAIVLALGHKYGTLDIGYEFYYNFKNKNLFYKNRPIKLSPHEIVLLEKLIQSEDKPIPCNVLEFEIWGNEPISKSSLRTLVSSLRKKLNPDMIETVFSFGYRLLLPKES